MDFNTILVVLLLIVGTIIIIFLVMKFIDLLISGVTILTDSVKNVVNDGLNIVKDIGTTAGESIVNITDKFGSTAALYAGTIGELAGDYKDMLVTVANDLGTVTKSVMGTLTTTTEAMSEVTKTTAGVIVTATESADATMSLLYAGLKTVTDTMETVSTEVVNAIGSISI